MTSHTRALRRRILTPNVSETRLDVRGFHVKNPASRELLETIGQTFLAGYAFAVEAARHDDAVRRLEGIPNRFRGFAYEGATMGFAVLDALPFGGSTNVSRFLAGAADKHVYMAYVGIGWAMARVPRFRFGRLAMPDPLLRWLALDGYGFHQAYFKTDRYVRAHYQEPAFPWPAGGPRSYVNRAVDQGIGRALWFVCGTAADRVADTIDGFPEHRRADLWSGAGLAATYAGGADEDELRSFLRRAGRYRPQVAQGSAFAAAARVRAGLVVPHVTTGTAVLCGMTPAEASALTDQRRPEGPDGDQLPAYELWRQRVANDLVAIGRN
ncbi:DUF1702 family protein [Micromonospora sp. NPDC047740]|uniref:DUF1702 family protein n=1 Tax=Micromonospora sp. NPDC047740 TaxID=3364254 RepID=UPI0037207330